MKKITTFFALLAITVSFTFAAPAASAEGNGEKEGQGTVQKTDPYAADFQAVESLFDNATFSTDEVPFDQIESVVAASPEGTTADGTHIAAIVLCWIVGWLGIHRVILGGRGMLILLYFITCGGIFGILPLVDFILLIVDAVQGGGTRYENNDQFIAW